MWVAMDGYEWMWVDMDGYGYPLDVRGGVYVETTKVTRRIKGAVSNLMIVPNASKEWVQTTSKTKIFGTDHRDRL